MKPIFRIAEDVLYSASFQPIDSKMYLLPHGNRALLIDPCVSAEARRLLENLGARELLILLTHEHFDHISGVDFWRERFPCRVLCSEACARALPYPRKNLSQYFTMLFCMQDDAVQEEVRRMNVEPFSCHADETFREQKELMWCGHQIRLAETPGHSPGSICIAVDGRAVFTGDSLTNSIPVITRLPGGSRQMYREITLPYLSSLPKGMIAFPGHGDPKMLDVLLEWEKNNASQG